MGKVKVERNRIQIKEFKNLITKYLVIDNSEWEFDENWYWEWFEDFKKSQYDTLEEFCLIYFASDIVNKDTHCYYLNNEMLIKEQGYIDG